MVGPFEGEMEEEQVWGGLGAFGQVKVEMRVGGDKDECLWEEFGLLGQDTLSLVTRGKTEQHVAEREGPGVGLPGSRAWLHHSQLRIRTSHACFRSQRAWLLAVSGTKCFTRCVNASSL